MKKDTIITIGVTATLLIILGYFIYSDLTPFKTGDNSKNIDNNTSTSTPDDLIVGELPKAPIPDLKRQFVVPEGIYSAEIVKNTVNQYNEIIEVLSQNPELRDEWLQLALLRKAIEDYEGAEEIWIYVSKVWPLDHVAFGNLGDLYMNYLVDLSKAEKYLLDALGRKSDNPQYVDNLYILFRFKQEDPNKALQLLLSGLDQLPDEIYFPVRVAEHYRDTGDMVNSRKFFNQVLTMSKQLGLTEFENYANEELVKLK